MSTLLDIEEADPRVRERLDPGIYVQPKDKDPASEGTRQIKLVNRLKRDCPHIAVHHRQNGGRQSDAARIRAEKMGVVAGQPDLGLDWPGGSAEIEMKDGEGDCSQQQIARLNQLHRMGKPVAVCRTAEGAFAWLARIGAPVRSQFFGEAK
jgi:hypothetical protein